MFTGIVEAIGEIATIEPRGDDWRVRITVGKLDLADVKLGDSIACNGVCLTVVEFDDQSFGADVSVETLDCTTWRQYAPGQPVNLEKALRAGARLGGHMVSGHVDGIGEVLERREDARSVRFLFRAPADLQKYIAGKGSISIDGTSLTVNRVDQDRFEINLVPHTLQETIAGDYRPGAQVNLEVDIIARYLERLLVSDTHNELTDESQ